MAVSAKLYSNFPLNALKALMGDLNDAALVVKVTLCTSAYTPNQETHTQFSDLTNEVTGTGYTAGGATLASKAVTEATRRTKFDAADASWTASTFTARYAVIYAVVTGKLIAYVDFGVDQSPSNSTLTVTWDATGIFGWTVPV